MIGSQFILPIAHELIVDLFAGGGGASTGIERATGRHVDIAVNHDADAIGMHEANHPQTRHYLSDVFDVDPREATGGQPVGLLHASPDCTHHSQARGGQPRSRAIRSLSWVVHRWGGTARPRVITLENVEQILQWSPLVAKRDPKTGRVLKVDGTVAAPGERVPVDEQFLIPDTKRKGHNWRHFVEGLRRMGYAVQWWTMVSADYGDPTTRERLFMVARCDGLPIVKPQPTHAKKPTKGRKPWRSAAECIDWSLPCPSIFERKRPLADATMRRIARGVRKYVLDAAEPFIVQNMTNNVPRAVSEPMATTLTGGHKMLVTPALVQMGYGERPGQAPRSLDLQQPLGTVVAGGLKHGLVAPTLMPLTHHGSDRVNDAQDPLPTITTAHRGEIALSSTLLVQAGHGEGKDGTKRWSYGSNDIAGPLGTVTASAGGQALASAMLIQFRHDKDGKPLDTPLPTITAGGASKRPAGAAHAMGVAVAFMAQHNTDNVGHAMTEPVSTIVGKGCTQGLAAAHLVHMRGNCDARDADQPLRTVSAGGEHHGVIECALSPDDEAGALRAAAFLMRYYGEGGQHGDLRDPAATITTKDRLALVTVTIKGTPYVIVDIGLRMLQPPELYAAQGFPRSYIIDRTAAGKRLPKSAQVRMCGNSVSPGPMTAVVAANFNDEQALQREAA